MIEEFNFNLKSYHIIITNNKIISIDKCMENIFLNIYVLLYHIWIKKIVKTDMIPK